MLSNSVYDIVDALAVSNCYKMSSKFFIEVWFIFYELAASFFAIFSSYLRVLVV